MRVYNKTTSAPARWGQMLVRQALVLSTFPTIGYLIISTSFGSQTYESPDYLPLRILTNFGNLSNISLNTNSWVIRLNLGWRVIVYTAIVVWIYLLTFACYLTDALWIFKGGRRNRLVDIIS